MILRREESLIDQVSNPLVNPTSGVERVIVNKLARVLASHIILNTRRVCRDAGGTQNVIKQARHVHGFDLYSRLNARKFGGEQRVEDTCDSAELGG